MRIHAIEHVPFEGLGLIEQWAKEKHYPVSRTLFYADGHLPLRDAFDALVIMGGPMGTYDAASFPWLDREKDFLRYALAAGKKILGICLGAQLLAEAIGGRVYPGKQREIGWFPVQSVAGNGYFPPVFTPLHWHGDTFDLPEDAQVFASTSLYRNQAFSYGKNCLGLQFHLELSPEDVTRLAANNDGELPVSPHVQPTSEIVKQKGKFDEAGKLLLSTLDRFFRKE